MKKVILVIILILIPVSLIQGCGTLIKSDPVNSELVISSTPIAVPSATPIPSPFDIKYQNYDDDYDIVYPSMSYKFEDIAPEQGEIIEHSLKEYFTECYYITWYDDYIPNNTMKIQSVTRDDRKYGIKNMVDLPYEYDEGVSDFLIYYYYLDDPDTIYDEKIEVHHTDTGEIFYRLVGITEPYSYSSIEGASDVDQNIDEGYTDEEIGDGGGDEEYNDSTISYTIDQVYEEAREDAKNAIYSSHNLDAVDQLSAICHFDDLDNVYFNYDGHSGIYTISFNTTYYSDWGSAAFGIGGNTYFITCQYVDQNGLKLVGIN